MDRIASLLDAATQLATLQQAQRIQETHENTTEIHHVLQRMLRQCDAPLEDAASNVILLSVQRLLMTHPADSIRTYYGVVETAFKLMERALSSASPSFHGAVMLQCCAMYLPDPTTESATVLSSQPEELRACLLSCLQSLVASFDQHAQVLAFIVSSLLMIAERDRCRSNASVAMKTLRLALEFIGADQEQHKRLWRSFLPGISIGVYKCINAPHQTSQTTVDALKCLCSLFRVCLSDENDAQDSAPTAFDLLQQALAPSTDEQKSIEEDPKDQEAPWRKEAAEKIDIILTRIFQVTSRATSWRVKLAVVQICDVVLRDCRKTLSQSLVRCHEQAMQLQMDAIPEVAVAASQLPVSTDQVAVLTDRFHTRLSTLVLKLPSQHEAENVATVSVLVGYIQTLGARLRPSLEQQVPSVLQSLCQLVQLSAIDVDLVFHKRIDDAHDALVGQFEKRFTYFREDSSVARVYQLLKSIGAIVTPSIVIDTAFELHQSSSVHQEIWLVVAALMEGHGEAIDIHVVGRLLDDLLRLSVWKNDDPPVEMALVLECIGAAAALLGRSFESFLLHVLHPLVEKLGSHHPSVERAALVALETIQWSCGYESLEILVERNMDYFMDALCMRLAHLDAFPLTPHVIDGLLRHVKLSSPSLLEELVRAVLQSIDLYQYDVASVVPLLHALQSILQTLPTDSKPESPSIPTSNALLLSSFLEEMRVLTGDFDVNCKEQAPKDPEDSEDSEKPVDASVALPVTFDASDRPPSSSKALVVSIIDRSSYFMYEDSDPTLCCLVLSMVREGIWSLRHDLTALRPLVHRLWPTLLHRVNHQNRPIAIDTCRLLSTVAEVVGDFIGDRFSEHVWPQFESQLQHLEKHHRVRALDRQSLHIVAENKTEAPVPARRTQEQKLLYAMLQCLRTITEHSNAMTPLVANLCASVQWILKSPQVPAEVHDETMRILLALGRLNQDEVVYCMAPMAHWVPPAPPSTRFPRYNTSALENLYGKLNSINQSAVSRRNAETILTRLRS